MKLYLEHEGDMDKIMAHAILVEFPDEARIRRIIEDEITKGAPAFDAFTKEAAEKKRARKRAWEKEKREFTASSSEMSSLVLAMSQRNQARMARTDSFLDQLAEKYAPKKTKAKRGRKWPTRAFHFLFLLGDPRSVK